MKEAEKFMVLREDKLNEQETAEVGYCEAQVGLNEAQVGYVKSL